MSILLLYDKARLVLRLSCSSTVLVCLFFQTQLYPETLAVDFSS